MDYLTAYLSVLSNLGGLSLPINVLIMVIVAYIVNPEFISEVTKDIFLISKWPQSTEREKELNDEKYKIARRHDLYQKLKKNLDSHKVT